MSVIFMSTKIYPGNRIDVRKSSTLSLRLSNLSSCIESFCGDEWIRCHSVVKCVLSQTTILLRVKADKDEVI